jgi:16S rRNA (guanine527-N7)-methyltransferase
MKPTPAPEENQGSSEAPRPDPEEVGLPIVASVEAAVSEALAMLPEAQRPPGLETQLQTFLRRLLETNLHVNLVSRRDTLSHVARFTRECLFLARLLLEDAERLQRQRPLRLLDLGSGGGFPGLVLKLALPDVEVQLVEGTRKKARFLAEASGALDLHKMGVLWARAEELADPRFPIHKPEFRNHFDWVSGKGLGKLQDSLELAAPFLAIEGAHWTFKGRACQEELQAASGLFRQRGFARLRLEPIPGDQESFVVGIRRLPPK